MKKNLLDEMASGLGRLAGRGPALELVLDGRPVHFDTPEELAAALQPRTEVTAAFVRLRASGDQARLRQELALITRVQRRMVDLVIWSFETGEPVHDAWREAESAEFADEHQWRVILRGLAEQRDVDDRFRRVAFAKFLRYLESRRVAVELALERDELAGGTREFSAADVTALQDGALEGAAEEVSYTSAKHSPVFRRLPPHQAVEISLGPGDAVPLFLAHRKLRLVATAQGWQLKDDLGLEIVLHEGRVIVGRADDCDVVLKNAPTDVSRHHLAIECHEDHVRLVDLSTQGTYLPRRALMETPRRH